MCQLCHINVSNADVTQQWTCKTELLQLYAWKNEKLH
jgi:hypothetical protein